MANENIEQISPPAFDIKSPLDVSKINPVGIGKVPEIDAAKQQAFDAQDKLIKSLEERYAQPNWFKVAAGFAKPQLGGFGASLGSAAEAMGQNVEAQRAMAPTVERMRAEVATGRLGLANKTEQSRAIDAYDAKGTPDISQLRYIYSLAPDSPVGQSIKERLALESGRREETAFGLTVQEKLKNDPALKIINDPAYKGIETDPAKRESFVKAVNDNRPDFVSPQEWASMGFSARQEKQAEAASKSMSYGQETGQIAAKEAEQSHDVLDELTSLRTLAVDPSLKPLFSLGRNGDLFAQYRSFLDKNPGNVQGAVEGLVNAAMEKLKNADEPTRAKADKLLKGMADLEVRLRGTLTNPTDAASVLSSNRSPNLANSQAGFVGILDQLGLNAYRQIEMNDLRSQMGLTDRKLLPTDKMRQFRNETRRLREQLAGQNALDTPPSWYFPDEAKKAAAPAATVAPTVAPTAKPAAAGTPSSRPTEKTFGGKTYAKQPNGEWILKP